jgi:hypothetical protein
MAVVTVSNSSYHINNQLIKKWDKIKDGKLKLMDNDKVYIVDGRERLGKSTFAIQQACYIDPTLIYDIKRICFSADEFLEAIRKTDSDEKTTKCVVFDEAFRGLSSRGAMSKVNKKIITALMEVGQKNLVIWIVLPSFFMLDLYAAMLRSNALFHITQDKKSPKRVFHVYPHKKKGYLYQSGVRKGWSYDIFTKARGNFYDNFPKQSKDPDVKAFYTAYLKKKRSSLVESEDNAELDIPTGRSEHKFHEAITFMKEKLGLSFKQIQSELKKIGVEYSSVQIMNIYNKHQEKIDFEVKKAIFLREKSEKELKPQEKITID